MKTSAMKGAHFYPSTNTANRLPIVSFRNKFANASQVGLRNNFNLIEILLHLQLYGGSDLVFLFKIRWIQVQPFLSICHGLGIGSVYLGVYLCAGLNMCLPFLT